MKRLYTKTDAMLVISDIIQSDAVAELEMVIMDKRAPKKMKDAVEILMNIYQIVHPLYANCPHGVWERETAEKIKKLKEKQ